jgi:hypothetical protein
METAAQEEEHMRAITEGYERQLWEELNSLLADAVPDDASEDDAERTIMLAMMGHDSEIHTLHRTIQHLARSRSGYLRERLEDDSPITRARRRLYGKWA